MDKDIHGKTRIQRQFECHLSRQYEYYINLRMMVKKFQNKTCHLDIKLYYTTDSILRKYITDEYCRTDIMITDYMTKPLIDEKFKIFCDRIAY